MNKFSCLVIGLLGVFLAANAFGQGPVVGKVGAATGTVSLTSAGGATKKIAAGAPVHEGDVVITGAGSTARVDFADRSVIKIGENSKCEIRKKGTKTADATRLHLFSGKMRVKVKADRVARAGFEVSTPTAVAGVRGTDFLVHCLPGPVTRVVVFKGIVSVRSLMQEVTRVINVPSGCSTRVSTGKPPAPIRRLSRSEIQREKGLLPVEEPVEEPLAPEEPAPGEPTDSSPSSGPVIPPDLTPPLDDPGIPLDPQEFIKLLPEPPGTP